MLVGEKYGHTSCTGSILYEPLLISTFKQQSNFLETLLRLLSFLMRDLYESEWLNGKRSDSAAAGRAGNRFG
jgi:hypothetical protein